MVRFTNKMNENYSHYNLNNNKALLDKLNTQMSTKKKNNEPMDDPTVSIRSLHFRGTLSEYNQYLGKNVTDALSWTDTTQTAIDTAKELMRSLKAEYTSASNGTNENSDRWIYYEGMANLVKEFFNTGNTSNENRYVFTGARTEVSLTFSQKDLADRAKELGVDLDDPSYAGVPPLFAYQNIEEKFKLEDLESYTYTARKAGIGITDSGVTEDEINSLNSTTGNETSVESVECFRLRLSYNDLDELQSGSAPLKLSIGSEIITVTPIGNDYEKTSADFTGNKVYLNYNTGNLIFGDNVKEKIAAALKENKVVSYQYSKSKWNVNDVKPEHYFNCNDIGLGTGDGKRKDYTDHEQSIEYNIGEGQIMKINANAQDVFTLDAIRDLNELYDALTAKDAADKKMKTLEGMKEDTARYPSEADQRKIEELMNAVRKEQEYAKSKIDKMLSNGITKSGKYFDTINLAGTNMGSVVNRLTLVKNRLTEHQTTVTAQASDNENIDISTLAVEVNSATLSYGAALQVTGKISQQSLVNFL